MVKKKILLINGWAMDRKVFQGLKESLADEYEFVEPETEYARTPKEFTQKVLECARDFGNQKIYIIGWSMGSILAIQVAVKMRQMVERMVLISATGRFTRDKNTEYQGWTPLLLDKMKNEIIQVPEAVLGEFNALIFTDKEKEEGAESLLSKLNSEVLNVFSKENLITGLDFLKNSDVRGLLSQIDSKTLIIHGDEDKLISMDSGKYVADRIKGSKMIVLKNVGHAPFLTSSEKVIKAIKEFLSQ